MLSSNTSIEGLLLGRLSEDEREVIEQRILADPAFFEQALIVEEDLLDLYVEGKLSDSQDFFEHSLAASPKQRQKLLTAMALKRFISEQDRSVPQSETVSELNTESWLRRFLFGKHRRRAEVNVTVV